VSATTAISNQTTATEPDRRTSSRFLSTATFLYALLFFSNAANHAYVHGIWPVRPIFIFAAIVLILLPQLYLRGQFASVASPLGIWGVSFLVITLAWFIGFGGGAVTELLQRTYAVLFLLFTYLLVSAQPENVRAARAAILCGVFLAVACNMLEILRPTTFLPPGEYYGRAAGFYGNPNQAGAAIVAGAIIAMTLVVPKWRWLFVAVTLVGVLLTLSRAAAVGWVVAMGLLVMVRALSPKAMLLGLGLVAASAFLVWKLLGESILEKAGIEPDMLLERVGVFIDATSVAGYSQVERERVAEAAIGLFEERPFMGHGLGTTATWSESAPTHNMYLYYMADHGFIGFAVFPLLIICAIWYARDDSRGPAWAFAGFAMLWGIFSHNIVGEYYALLSFATIAAWGLAGSLTARHKEFR
jgi:O-antigen ligase